MSLAELQTENDRLRGEIAAVTSRLSIYEAAGENVALTAELRDTRRIEIVKACAATFGVTPEAVMSKLRTEAVAYARQLAMVVIRETEPLSLAKVGLYFNRDHGTVIHAIRAVEARKSWPEQKKKIAMVRLMFGLVE